MWILAPFLEAKLLQKTQSFFSLMKAEIEVFTSHKAKIDFIHEATCLHKPAQKPS